MKRCNGRVKPDENRTQYQLQRLVAKAEADDPDDAFLLSMAMDGDADYLVTGDRRVGLLQRGRIGQTRIVSPSVFCSLVL